ncbi:hypothetical protein CASFOL_020921 [Castilleja foliolosa]|uniref:Neprosin PEP catalytic domain-containing protein n=1 Tax=Castilleja foliolosa TaxID=1961234 RepID=A0ABD3D3L0_9LAMI
MVSIRCILSIFLYNFISSTSSVQSVNFDNTNWSSDQPRVESEKQDHTRDYLKKINKLVVKTIQAPPEMPRGPTPPESCPENTIPTKKDVVIRARSLIQTSDQTVRTEKAYLQLQGGIYYGVEAIMDVWAPHVDNSNKTSESLIQLEMFNFDNGNRNTIGVGWQVNPELYGDDATRLTIYWEKYTYYNQNTTFCYNDKCSAGFVQTNNTIRLGEKFITISSYVKNGPHFAFPVSMYKDSQTKNWWLIVNEIVVGYWPWQLFSNDINGSANGVQLGGKITTTTTNPTMPQMGSGHFPKEGYGKAACIQAIQAYLLMDRKDPEKPLKIRVLNTKPKCYGLEVDTKYKALGNYFYYGGPGGADPNCN